MELKKEIVEIPEYKLSPGKIKIYVDGSCRPQLRIGAWVAIVFAGEKKITLQAVSHNTTHNRMELTAVIKALEYVKTQKIVANQIAVYSDSQYVVNLRDRKETLIQNNFYTKKGKPIQNSDLVQILIRLIETVPIHFVKVKAHQKKPEAVDYNREVDILARKILKTYLTNPQNHD